MAVTIQIKEERHKAIKKEAFDLNVKLNELVELKLRKSLSKEEIKSLK